MLRLRRQIDLADQGRIRPRHRFAAGRGSDFGGLLRRGDFVGAARAERAAGRSVCNGSVERTRVSQEITRIPHAMVCGLYRAPR